MPLKYEPIDVFAEMEKNFSSIEQFDKLVQVSAFYYKKYGPLDTLKLFIPNSNKNDEGYAYLNTWTPEKAEQAANDVVRVFTGQRISNAYVKETHADGVYLAFKTETSTFLSYSEYIAQASYMIYKGRQKDVKITAHEWLRDFPYEFHAAWYNRPAVANEIVLWLEEPGNELFAQALYDGSQNWLEDRVYPKIDNWNPKEKFITVFEWDDTFEEKQRLLEEFKIEYR